MISWIRHLIAGRPAHTRSRSLDAGAAGEVLASKLAQVPGFRVLRALNQEGELDVLPAPAAGERIGAVIDTETTGLDPISDRLIEIAAQRFLFDAHGVIHASERPRAWLEDPGGNLPERVQKLTGLSDEVLAGQHFDDAAIAAHISSADLIIAHNAAFDRPFIDQRFAALRQQAWACSLNQIDWLELGFDGRSLGHLLLQRGWYFDGHRAANDVRALTRLLSENLPDGATILWHLLASCESNSVRFDAVGAPYEAKDALKQRGYRWDARQRCWWREVGADRQAEESAWLDLEVYRGRGGPATRPITARERFARDD